MEEMVWEQLLKLFSAAYLFKELTIADCSLFGSILMFDALFDANKGFVSSWNQD